jgi:hypothetical protein
MIRRRLRHELKCPSPPRLDFPMHIVLIKREGSRAVGNHYAIKTRLEEYLKPHKRKCRSTSAPRIEFCACMRACMHAHCVRACVRACVRERALKNLNRSRRYEGFNMAGDARHGEREDSHRSRSVVIVLSSLSSVNACWP